MKPYRFLLLTFLILLTASAFYYSIWSEAPITAADSSGYLTVAADLANGQLSEYHFRTIGYPLILLFTGSVTAPTKALFILQLTMYIISVLLIACIMLREKLTPTLIGIFIILAILPPAVEYTAYALPEISSMLFLTIGFYSLYRSLKQKNIPWSIAAGFAWGIAALIRPDYQLLALFVSLCALVLFLILKQFNSWLKVFMPLLIVSTLILLGYMSFNYIKFNHFSLAYFSGFTTTAKSVNMLESIPESYGEIKEILIRHRDLDLVNGASHTAVNYIYKAVEELQETTGLALPELGGMLQKMTINLILRNPLKYFVSVGNAMANYLMPSAGTLSIFSSQIIQLLWYAIHFLALLFFILLLCTLTGTLVFLPTLDRETLQNLNRRITANLPKFTLFLVAVAISIYSALVSTMLAVGDSRYHVPTMLLSLFALVFFARFLNTSWKSDVSVKKINCQLVACKEKVSSK